MLVGVFCHFCDRSFVVCISYIYTVPSLDYPDSAERQINNTYLGMNMFDDGEDVDYVLLEEGLFVFVVEAVVSQHDCHAYLPGDGPEEDHLVDP